MSDAKSFLKAMGNRILLRRRELNLTQEQLAEKAGISYQIVSSAERGAKAIRPENLVKISIALDISTDYLLTGIMGESERLSIAKNIDQLSPTQLSIINEIIESTIKLCLDNK